MIMKYRVVARKCDSVTVRSVAIPMATNKRPHRSEDATTAPLRYCAIALLFFCSIALFSCGPGWEGYEDNYSNTGAPSSGSWEGGEKVYVVLAEEEVTVALAGMQIHDYNGAPAVLLSDVIIQSSITNEPERYRYNFTATDGYDLLIKRYNDVSLLPSWEEMKNGYLYYDDRYNDLTCGWTKHPWGSAESAYNVKYMNGGTITLIENP